MKASVREAVTNRLISQAELFQLHASHHPILTPGKRRHSRVWVSFASLSQQSFGGVWDRLDGHAPERFELRRTGGAHN